MKRKHLLLKNLRWVLLFMTLPFFGYFANQAKAQTLPTPDNVVLHLDATTISGLSDNAPVTSWNDLSGKNHHASAVNPPAFKQYGFSNRPSVNFSGNNQYMEIAHTTALNLTQLTIFTVFKNKTTVSSSVDFGVITSKELGSSPWENRNWWFAVQHSQGQLWFRTSSGGQQPRNDLQDTQHNYKDGLVHMASVVVPGTGNGNATLSVDGFQKASALSNTPNVQTAPVRIGAGGSSSVNRFFHGDIGEIIIYNRALSLEERQEVELYLGNKWLNWNVTAYFNIAASAGVGGQIVPTGQIQVPEGRSSTFNITANAPYYTISDVLVDGTSIGAVSSYTFTNITANHTIEAVFSPVTPQHTITATAGLNGSITPQGSIEKYAGESHTFYMNPIGNYGVTNVWIDGNPIGPTSSYTFTNIQQSHTIHAEFGLTEPIVHLDADAISGLSHGQVLTTWEDKSGFGNNATQSNNNNKPVLITEDGLNGRQVVRFDGTNDFMQVANNLSLDMDQVTMFAVYRNTFKPSYPSNSIGVITSKSRGHTNRSWWLVLNYNFTAGGTEAGINPGSLWFRTSSGGNMANNLYHNGTYNNGDAYMVAVVVPPTAPGAQSVLFIDGEQKHQSNAGDIDHAENQIFKIGAGTNNSGGTERYFGGDLAELIIYNRALSSQERKNVESYLYGKWFGPQDPEITQWPTASDITYGQGLANSALSGGEASVPGTFSFADPSFLPSQAGNISAQVVFTPDDTQLYNIITGSVDLTVLKKYLSITAQNASKVYGEPDPEFSVSFQGFVFDDTQATLNGTLEIIREEGEDTGDYLLSASGLSSANYEIEHTNGSFTISQKLLTITALDASKVYGEPDPEFSVSFQGLVFDDTQESLDGLLEISREAGEDVGDYLIIASGLSSANYEIVYTGGIFTISQKLLTITALDQTRQYSDPNPAWEATAEGFINGEDFSNLTGALSFTGDAVESDHNTAPGNYAIIPGGYTSINYSIIYIPGYLLITPEDSELSYLGSRLMATNSSSSATLDLRVMLSDFDDGFRGNITNASLKFLIYDSDMVLVGQTPVLQALNLMDDYSALIQYNYPVTLNADEDFRMLYINVEVGGFYQGAFEEPILAVVYRPQGDHVTGGGFIVPSNPVGSYPWAANVHTNFGFNFKYHKKTNELQGELNLVLRDVNGVAYQFKSTQAVALGVNTFDPSAKTAFISVKGNLMKGNTIEASNLDLYATMTDRGNPGHNDDIGFTIWNGNTLLYSSNWDGNSTNRIKLGGGNLIVHSGFALEDFKSTRIDNSQLSDENGNMNFRAFPNPFKDVVNFSFKAEANTDVIVEIFDARGVLIEKSIHNSFLEGEQVQIQITPRMNNTNFIIYRLTLNSEVFSGKLIFQNN